MPVARICSQPSATDGAKKHRRSTRPAGREVAAADDDTDTRAAGRRSAEAKVGRALVERRCNEGVVRQPDPQQDVLRDWQLLPRFVVEADVVVPLVVGLKVLAGDRHRVHGAGNDCGTFVAFDHVPFEVDLEA